jgi:peroxiredoxin
MKNLSKSIFIAILPVLALYSTYDSIFSILNTGFSVDNLGQLLTSATIALFFIGLFTISQARTSEALSGYTITILIGFLMGVIPPAFMPSFNINGVALNVVLTIGWILYIKWYSVFDERDSTILKVGKLLPNFVLENTKGEKISSSTFNGNPTIYLFYRGNWCPLCMAQIKEIAGQYTELENRGVNMVFVSPQPHFYSERLSKRYDLGFHYLQDTDNEVAKQLGILAENGIPTGFQALGFDSDTVMPTVVITNPKGRIAFADLTDNYRVRPEPETFFEVIDGM